MRWMIITVKKATLLSLLFTFLAILGRILAFIATPLWDDAFLPQPFGYNITNVSHQIPVYNSTSATRQTNPYFNVLMQGFIPMVFWGFIVLFIRIFLPSRITEREYSFSKTAILLPGSFQALSSVIINYSLSGTRTPPYLQAVLNNFTIPIQFTVRFLILWKRPTCRKLLCACAVIGGEFLCLIPTIFPGLESKEQHEEEGGATGVGRILFPILFVSSQIPFAVSNSIIERAVKDKGKGQDTSTEQINMAYYMFWYNVAWFLGAAVLFWMDIIPGLGYSPNIAEFGKRMWFNIQCFVGLVNCWPSVCLLGWTVVWSNVLAAVSIAYILRYSEGANFLIVTMTLRSPLLLLFWTLFQERPFQWNPQAHLSTWLSIGALIIMIPAIVIYSTGSPEVSYKKSSAKETPTEEKALLNEDSVDRNDLNEDSVHKSLRIPSNTRSVQQL